MSLSDGKTIHYTEMHPVMQPQAAADLEIYLARTQGFCAGVASAITIVERALDKYGAPLHVYHEIVHNTRVVEDFRERGVIFVDDLDEVPEGARLIFSAHGVSPEVTAEAVRRGLRIVDATCPLVKKVHREAERFCRERPIVILIGHKGHQEMLGTSGHVPAERLRIVETVEDIDALDVTPETPVAYLTQTTLSVDDTRAIIERLTSRFRDILGPPRSDICYATQNRQDAVKELARICEVLIICGSSNSSNSNRLRETGLRAGVETHLIDSEEEFRPEWIEGRRRLGISSGASVPRSIVERLVSRLQNLRPGARIHRFEDPEKEIVFPLPEV